MPSSLEAAEIAAAMLGGGPMMVEAVYGGRNSQVYRLSSADGPFALKLYGPAGIHKDRLGREKAALDFLRASGVERVPVMVAADPARNAAVLSWIEGGAVEPVRAAEIDAALEFARCLHERRGWREAEALEPAAEACPAPIDAFDQTRRRLDRLRREAGDRLAAFLDREAAPALAQVWRFVETTAAGRFETAKPLDRGRLTLSPSDFGFHNARRQADGSLAFFDFEYFGWDDPVKLTADFLLHPGMNLEEELQRRFRMGAGALYGDDPHFEQRLHALLPLYALRWSMIVLNPFLPERRPPVHPPGGAGERETMLEAQLAKARRLVETATINV